jgi:DHA2 family lincomycin resistance protein-like MFS transporter
MKKEVYTIDSNATIKETLSYFSSKKISGAPIVDKAGNMVGFISDGDILRWISSVESLFVYSDSSQETFNKNVADLMDRTVLEIGSKQVISVDSDADMAKVCSILSGKHLKKLPVLEDGRLVGVINASNIIKYMVSNI